ncbi:hypothetical protein [Paraflavitalea speifideaquila]|uniref:hypothetical protein n=1 Tax=Paraflavitalea speifideaquila TaxID=3076558 RepID=UPI0028E39E8F|nr:hypothetical protein [Paraflavitalea speifideiaquila]
MLLSTLIRYTYLLITALLPATLPAQFVTPGVVSPSSQTIVSGTAPALSATAPSGGSGSYPYMYTFQWQSSPNGSTWTNISGATSGSSCAAGPITANTYFRLFTYENGTPIFPIQLPLPLLLLW